MSFSDQRVLNFPAKRSPRSTARWPHSLTRNPQLRPGTPKRKHRRGTRIKAIIQMA